MPGPLPKNPATRQRTNKSASAAELDPNAKVRTPTLRLADFPDGTEAIHQRTKKWWRVVWRSPMAPRWLEADIERLYVVAVLRNRFYSEPTNATAAEIRQQERELGLTPMDRRRLEWHIAGPRRDAAVQVPQEAPAESVDAGDEDDPRQILRLVQ